jgi:hypothetical protein
MVRLNEVMLSFDIPCYYSSAVFIPYSLVLFELMGVDPRFQRAFLLNRSVQEYFHRLYKYLFW